MMQSSVPSSLVIPLPKSKPDHLSSESNALKQFIGQELIRSLSQLGEGNVMGPWRGKRPLELRGSRSFKSTLYGDDHAHGHAELCLLLEGSCRFSLADEGAILEAGDLVICPAEIPHAEAFVTKRRAYRLVWWSLNLTDPTVHVTRYKSRDGFALDHRMSLSALPAEPRRRLQRLRDWAAGEEAPPIDGMRESLLTLALALFRRALEDGGAQMDTRELVVQRAIEFVRANTERALSLADVAREVHVSPNYLTSLFRSISGKSLGRFITDERMQRAAALLVSSELSIKEVAAQLGFTDSYGFSRTFKAFSGRSPTEWRAKERK